MTKQDINPAFDEMTRSITMGDAMRYGVDAAFLLHEIRFWLFRNMANGRNLREGYYWTYDTAAEYAKHFPCFSAKKIARLLRDLETAGAIKSGSFNKHSIDRTKWYTTERFKADSWKKKQSLTNKQPESSDINQSPECSELSIGGSELSIDQCPNLSPLTNYTNTTTTNTHTANQNSKIQAGDHLIPAGQEPHITRPSKQPNNQPAKQSTFYNPELRDVSRDHMNEMIHTDEFRKVARLKIPEEDIDPEWSIYMTRNTGRTQPHHMWLAGWMSFVNQYRPKPQPYSKRPNQQRNSTGGVTYDNANHLDDLSPAMRKSRDNIKDVILE